MLRSSVGFDWKTDCFICSKQAITDIRHKGRNDVHDVGRSKFVQMRFKNETREMMNLHVLYMEDCKIILIQQQKKQFITGHAIKSTPFNDDSNNAFNKFCLWSESESGTDLLTLTNYKKQCKGFPNQMKHTQPSC